MKKGHGLDRALDAIPREQLEGMNIGALLARLKRLRWCEEARDASDLSDEEVASAQGRILFKADPAWRIAYDDLREILAAREHVDSR